MSTNHHHDSGRYEIRLKGHLDSRRAAWFDGMSLTNESDGITVIRGPVIDQAALHGLLQKLRDLNLPLVSVTQIDPDPSADRPSTAQRATKTDGNGNHRPRPTTRPEFRWTG